MYSEILRDSSQISKYFRFSKSTTQASGSSTTRGTVSSKIRSSSVCFSVKKDMPAVIVKKEVALANKEIPEIENA